MSASPTRALAVAAGAVIVALTTAAFWLSYAHLAEVASAYGLKGSPVRAWAWPATLDLFIVAGELLMLRAALSGRTDVWAIGLTVVGSGGSIALNVAGVGAAAQVLDYVVAAVPPTAALLAFGALMRQVHQALAGHAEAPVEDTSAEVTVTGVERAATLADTSPEVTVEVSGTSLPAIESAPVKPLVICGDQRVWRLADTPAEVTTEVTLTEEERLSPKAALAVIESCRLRGTSAQETAVLATRSLSYVKKVFARLDDERGATQMPGQLSLVKEGVSA